MMRKRWTWNPWPLAYTWFVGGLIALIIVASQTAGCDAMGCGLDAQTIHISTLTIVTFCAWLGPFVVVALWFFLPYLWHALPHRVEEPVTTDLREVSK